MSASVPPPPPPATRSKSRSRTRGSRYASTRSVPYLPQGPDDLLLPEGSVSEEAVELLHEFVHPGHRDKRRADTEDTIVAEVSESESGQDETSESDDGEDEEDWDALKERPWYRRPSPLWLLCITPFSSIAMSACAAPRVEIYTLLACQEHKPEYTTGNLHYGVDRYDDVLPITFTEDDNAPPLDGLLYPLLDSRILFAAGGGIMGTLAESKDTTKCASDPVVQASAAKLIAVMTTTMGVLSCLTTAFWGSLSDRYGRLRVLGLSVIGLLFNDFIFIFVYFFSSRLPGGYWFLLLGPVVEGVFGGLTCMVTAVHAYLADCSSPGSRSRIFSLGVGLLFVGMALGPSLGALLVHATHTPLVVFYLATVVHFLFALYAWGIVPESLPARAQKANRRRAERRRLEEREAESVERMEGRESVRGSVVRVLGRTKRVFAFLSPLSVFAPQRVVVAPGAYLGKRRRDWSLTFIAASYGFAAFVMASYQYKFQYAAATFGWTSEELGYWLSLVAASRAIYLTVILPLLIKFFNRPRPEQAIQLPIEPSEPLLTSEPSSSTLVGSPSSQSITVPPSSDPLSPDVPGTSSSPSTTPHLPRSQYTHAALSPHTASFDLHLARASLALEAVCYALLPLAPNALAFSAFGVLVAWGGGFNPAVQALALELYARQNLEGEGEGGGGEEDGDGDGDGKRKRKREGRHAETGRLFGAMSVVQVMCAQIFGPTIFGLTYMKTVARTPSAIFWVSSLCICISLVFICLVRLPKTAAGVEDASLIETQTQVYGAAEDAFRGELEREETLVDVTDTIEALQVRRKGSQKGQRPNRLPVNH